MILAEKMKMVRDHGSKKKYYHHSGYIGGIKEISAKELLEKHPTDLITKAVKGMLPKGPLGRKMFKKLKVYAGPDHPHSAQMPKPLELADAKAR